MKNYTMITPESLIKISRCFSSSEEITTFMINLNDIVDELLFQGHLIKRVDDENKTSIVMTQICIISQFVKENIELIHQLISSIESKKINEEEIKRLLE